MRKVVIAGMIGNGLEWYDFALYGHFVPILSRLFFPNADPMIGLIAAFGVFAAGFFMRPLGAILFGYIGDKYGRRVALSTSILLMAIPTACIGLLPTYAVIGIWAPIILTIIRLLQGLSLGGEFSGSIAFVVEHAPANRRGLAGSTAMISMNLGILAGTAAAALCSSLLPVDAFEEWGWRIPFIIGLGVGMIGLYIRSHLHESPLYQKMAKDKKAVRTPVRDIFTSFKTPLLQGIIVYITVTVPFYTFVIFLRTYMTSFLGHSFEQASHISTIALVICTALLPIAGHLSDKFGRKPLLYISSLGFILLTYPAFMLINHHGFMMPLLGNIIFGILVAFYMGPVPSVLVELFPTSVRYTGVGLSYNLSAAILGGTVPAVATHLIHMTGNHYALAYYIIFFSIVSFIGTCYLQERYKKPLN